MPTIAISAAIAERPGGSEFVKGLEHKGYDVDVIECDICIGELRFNGSFDDSLRGVEGFNLRPGLAPPAPAEEPNDLPEAPDRNDD